jgi:hypothetical protein
LCVNANRKNREGKTMGELIPFKRKLKDIRFKYRLPMESDLIGHWGITNKNEILSMGTDVDSHPEEYLRKWGELKKGEKIIKEFEFNPPIGSKYNSKHTTDWARAYWDTFFPNSNFDEMFETDEPGVFDRFQSHEEIANFTIWKYDKQLILLYEELLDMGYRLLI